MHILLLIIELILAVCSVVAAPNVANSFDAGLAFTLLVIYPLMLTSWLDKHYFPP